MKVVWTEPAVRRLEDLREHDRYRIVYRTRGDRVEILTVFERHRRLPAEDLASRGPRRRKPGR